MSQQSIEHDTVALPREWSLILPAPDVLALLAGTKATHSFSVTWRNSTVLGYGAKSYWPNLMFEHARYLSKSSLMVAIAGKDAPPGPNFEVPYCHPNDVGRFPVEDLGWYRVRPRWEAGDAVVVKEAWAPSMRDPEGLPWEDDRDGSNHDIIYRADGDAGGYWSHDEWVDGKFTHTPINPPWRSGASLPRWAARIVLEITGMSGERRDDGSLVWIATFRRVTP